MSPFTQSVVHLTVHIAAFVQSEVGKKALIDKSAKYKKNVSAEGNGRKCQAFIQCGTFKQNFWKK